MFDKDLKIGHTFESFTIVTKQLLAVTVESGDLEVFSTPMMIALMEKCCFLSIKDYIRTGFSSVGTYVKVSHMYPSSINRKITAKSKVVEINEKSIKFYVEAFDNDICIGKGFHERAIVDKKKFCERLSNNCN